MKKEVITTVDDFIQWCSKLKPVWALDTETTSLKWLELELIGWSLCDGKQACYVDFISSKDSIEKYCKILQYYINESSLIIFHNAAYDISVLKKYGVII